MMFTDKDESKFEAALSEIEQGVTRAITDMKDSLTREIRMVNEKLDGCITKAVEIIASLPDDTNKPRDL